jgi:hypothetical protein
LSVARAIYLRLPEDARLWLRQKDFVEPDEDAIRAALSMGMPPFDAAIGPDGADSDQNPKSRRRSRLETHLQSQRPMHRPHKLQPINPSDTVLLGSSVARSR